MAFRWYFSIRTKILLVLVAVVVPAVGLYLGLASRISFQDKTLLIYELNQTSVRTLGDSVEARMGRVFDKLRAIGRAASSTKSSQFAREYLKGDREMVRVGLLSSDPNSANGKRWVEKRLADQPGFLEGYGQDPDYLDRVRRAVPIPIDAAVKQGTAAVSAILPPAPGATEATDVPPLMTVALSLGHGRVIYADVRTETMLETFGSGSIASVWLVDSNGRLMASSDQKRLLQANQVSSDPLVKIARQSKVRSEVRRFDDGPDSFLGSFYKISAGNLLVVSRTDQGEAFAAARVLMKKSLLYAIVVVSAAFLIALFFAHSLTVPIQKLVNATRMIAQGNFNLLVPVRSGRGDELSLLANSFNSMTHDLRSSREKIEEYSRDLEKKVADRTVAIRETQEALVRTTRLASVGEVAGRAAHEVLNPLTNISTRLERVQTTSFAETAKDIVLLREIVGAWDKDYREKGMKGLVDGLESPSRAIPGKKLIEEDLANLISVGKDSEKRLEALRGDVQFLLKETLRIAKIVNGMRQLTRVSGNRKKLDLHAVLDEALESVGDLLTKNEVSRERFFCQGSPSIFFDHDELLQVMTNLIRNSLQAIQAGRREGVKQGEPSKVWLTTQVVSSPRGPRVMLRISDNGPGIAVENAAKVFDTSFTTKSMEEGTGLGLSICRRFIRAYDGEIELEKSEPGIETSFVIDLPEGGQT